MKYFVSLSIVLSSFLSFGQIQQTWPEAYNAKDVAIIVNEITTPMLNGELDKVLARTMFPFDVNDKSYTKTQLKFAFYDLFTEEMRQELIDINNYEVMNPEGDYYMLVCSNAPDGYEAAVPVFRLENGVWMLSSLDLYEPEEDEVEEEED